MRVLLWTDHFWPSVGGAEVFALNLLAGLRGRGVEYAVVADAGDAAGADDGIVLDTIPLCRLPMRSALARRDLDRIVALRARLRAWVARRRPELVHVVLLGPDAFFLDDVRRRLRLPYLVTLHQHLPPERLAPDAAVARTLRGADWVAACSHAVRDALLRSMPELGPRCTVIHNALPDGALLPPTPPPATPRLLCLGRLVDYKGFDVAVDALPSILARHPNTQLVIAGDGPQRAPLAARARRLGLSDRVEFLGWVHPRDTATLITSASAVLLPSRLEPSSLVALETALAGRPIVASRTGGIPEIVAHDSTGLLVAVGDAGDLARAVLQLLADPAAAAAMGRRARTHAQRRFSWQAHLDAYANAYARLAAAGR